MERAIPEPAGWEQVHVRNTWRKGLKSKENNVGVNTFLEKQLVPSIFLIILNYIFFSLACKVIKRMRFVCFQTTAFYQKVCAMGWGISFLSELNTSSYGYVPFRTFYSQSSRKYPKIIIIQSLLAILPVRSWAYCEERIVLPEGKEFYLLWQWAFSVSRDKRELCTWTAPPRVRI